MSREVVRYSGAAPSRRSSPYDRQIQAIQGAAGVQVTIDRAITGVGEQAMFDVVQVKRTQRELEQLCPDASAELNLIASTTCMSIARSIARFGFDIGG